MRGELNDVIKYLKSKIARELLVSEQNLLVAETFCQYLAEEPKKF